MEAFEVCAELRGMLIAPGGILFERLENDRLEGGRCLRIALSKRIGPLGEHTFQNHRRGWAGEGREPVAIS